MSGKIAIRVPAQTGTKRRAGSDVVLTAPWCLPPKGALSAEGPPQIVSYEGEQFVEQFLDAIADSGDDGLNPELWPDLLPYRDWSEPPEAMVDAGGRPRYPTAIERQDLPESLIEPVPHGADDPLEGGDEPEWLRKLYRPVHKRFNLVSCEMICARPYLPPVATERILETGMVVRRLLPGDTPRWQDWIANGEDRGMWVHIADEQMRPVGVDGAGPVDPRKLPKGVIEYAVRERLDIDDDEPLELEVAPMSPVPDEAIDTDERGHTVAFGYLPVASSQLEVVEPISDKDLDDVRDKLTEETVEALEGLPGQAEELHDELWGRWREMLEAFFPEPEDGDVQQALRELIYRSYQETPPLPISDLPELSQWEIHQELLQPVLDLLTTPLTSNFDPIKGRLLYIHDRLDAYLDDVFPDALYEVMWEMADDEEAEDPDTWWSDVFQEVHAKTSDQLQPLALSHSDAFDQWLKLRLHAALNEVSEADDDLLRMATLVILRWIRQRRVELLEGIYEQLEEHLESAPLPDQSMSDDRLELPVLGDEIEAWLEAEALDGDTRVQSWPWPPLDFSAFEEHKRWHADLYRIEKLLEVFDDRLFSAGLPVAAPAEVTTVLQARAERILDELPIEFASGDAPELDVQPARGLVVFPTAYPSDELFEEVIGSVDDSCGEGELPTIGCFFGADPSVDGVGVDDERLEAIVEAHDGQLRPRYDADHLYAVWCFARVAGRRDCDPDQIIYSRRTEPFSIAEPTDVLGIEPVPWSMPDLKKMMRDLPRIPLADAKPYAMVNTPPDSGFSIGSDPEDTRRRGGVAWVCSFGIPVFTICAWVMFNVILTILLAIPGMAWMLLLKFCRPASRTE